MSCSYCLAILRKIQYKLDPVQRLKTHDAMTDGVTQVLNSKDKGKLIYFVIHFI